MLSKAMLLATLLASASVVVCLPGQPGVSRSPPTPKAPTKGVHVMRDINTASLESGNMTPEGGFAATQSEYVNFYAVAPGQDGTFDYCPWAHAVVDASSPYLNQTHVPTQNPQGFIQGSNKDFGNVFVHFPAYDFAPQCTYDGAIGKFGSMSCTGMTKPAKCVAPTPAMTPKTCEGDVGVPAGEDSGAKHDLTPIALCQW